MKITKALILAFFLLPFFSYSQSEELDMTEVFFQKYSKDIDKSFEYLFSLKKWDDPKDKEDEFKIVEDLKSTIESYPLGKYYGSEKVAEKIIGNCFKIQIYIVKYEKEPLFFCFKYYKPNKDWTYCTFSIDSDVKYNLDFEKIMKESIFVEK